MNDELNDELIENAGIFPTNISVLEKDQIIRSALTADGLIKLLTSMVEPLRRGEWYSVVDDIENTIIPTLNIMDCDRLVEGK